MTVASGGASVPEFAPDDQTRKPLRLTEQDLRNTNVDDEDTRRHIGKRFDRRQRVTGIRHGRGAWRDAQFKERLR